MKTRPLVLILCFTFGAVLVIAQSLPRTLPTMQKGGYVYMPAPPFGSTHWERRSSRIGGKKYESVIAPLDEVATREWQPSSPLPLSLDKTEAIARGELRRLVKDESAWVVSDFQLSRFKTGPGWYYAVSFEPAMQLNGQVPDSFTLLMDLSGKFRPVFRLADNN